MTTQLVRLTTFSTIDLGDGNMHIDHQDWWPRLEQRLECEGPPGPAQNSASIHCTPRVLEDIHMGFSFIFILCAFSISTLARVDDLSPIAKIQSPWCFRAVSYDVASLEACDHHWGDPRASIFSYYVLQGRFPYTFTLRWPLDISKPLLTEGSILEAISQVFQVQHGEEINLWINQSSH